MRHTSYMCKMCKFLELKILTLNKNNSNQLFLFKKTNHEQSTQNNQCTWKFYGEVVFYIGGLMARSCQRVNFGDGKCISQ